MNRVFLTGQIESMKILTKDVMSIQLITSHKWTDSLTGEKKEDRENHTVIFYNKMAHLIKSYSRVGMKILVEGYIKTRKEISGNDHKEIIAKSLEFFEPVRIDGNKA